MKRSSQVLICAGASAAAMLFSAVGAHLFLPPVIALAGFMAAEWGLAYAVPVIAAGALGFFSELIGSGASSVTGGLSVAAVCLAVTFVLVSAACCYCLRRKVPHRWALLIYSVIVCVGMYLALCLASILAGDPPYTGVVDALRRFGEELESVGSAYSATAKENLAEMIAAVPEMLMMFCVLIAELAGMAILMISRMWYRVFRKEPMKMAELSMWQLPSSLIWGTLFFAAACGLAFALKLSIAAPLAWTVGLIFVSLYAVQGMAYLNFVFDRVGASGTVRAVTWVAAVLLTPYSAFFLAMLGLVEQLTRKRRKIVAYERRHRLERFLHDKLTEYEKYGYNRTEGDEAPEGPFAEGDNDDKDKPEKGDQ